METCQAILLFFVTISLTTSENELDIQFCSSPQYLLLGKRQYIDCSFPEVFFGVYWYNSTNTVEEYPVFYFQNSQKGGAGYSSGEFDILPNGSLVIHEVSFQHDHSFAVEYLPTKQSSGVTNIVTVTVVVKPQYPFPKIHGCEVIGNPCFIQADPTNEVYCSVTRARPLVHLEWFTWSSEGYNKLPYNETISTDSRLYTTRIATKDTFQTFSYLAMLECKASGQQIMFQDMTSLAMVENTQRKMFNGEPVKLSFEIGSTLKLVCRKGQIDYFIWKRSSTTRTYFERILFKIVPQNNYTYTFTSGFDLNDENALTAFPVRVHHEGLYSCVFGGAASEGETLYSISTYVKPIPGYLLVDGCQTHNYCIMDVKPEGTLTCSVKGIRPEVKLKWKNVPDGGTAGIVFPKQETTTKQKGDTYDTSVSSDYRVTGSNPSVVTVQCEVAEPVAWFVNLTTTVHLIVTKTGVPVPKEENSSFLLPLIAVLLAFLLATVLIAIFIRSVIYRRYRRNKTDKFSEKETEDGVDEEETPMIPTLHRRDDLKDLKEQFLKQLKDNYKEQYNAVQPIPFKRKVFCVNKIFVESEIEILSDVSKNIEDWEKANSFHDLFQGSQLKAKRIILEGDPGYGKSILTLQLLYDWCNRSPASYLENLDVLIVIRLRQVGGVKSFFLAIKKLLLPKETHLNEIDIKNILSSFDSLLIVLDGYDEYPDKEKVTDFLQIINSRMFRNSNVILTTRTSYLPKTLLPLTMRARLTGFNEQSQDDYIKKAFVSDYNNSVEKLRNLKGHPTLLSICQVPLFFVMIVHMTKIEDGPFQLSSVTQFFNSIINSLQSHIENKTRLDDQQSQVVIDKGDFVSLDKVAYDGLSGNSQQIVWDKRKMITSIGEKNYDLYIRTGILIEEEVLQSIERNVLFGLPNVRTKLQVRFYHKLFCEWFAAHHFANVIVNSPVFGQKKIFKQFNPMDLHYVYRFACGVNKKAASRIIKHLRSIDECRHFATLCVLEQSGEADDIEESIVELCKEGVIVSSTDSLILQMSSLQLLEFASRKKIPISYVGLHNCIMSVAPSATTILLTSGFRLSSTLGMDNLDIFLANKQMKDEGAMDILKFAFNCSTLKCLWITGCVPPFHFDANCIPPAPKSTQLKVQWRLFSDSPMYVLDLTTGNWEKGEDGKELSIKDHKTMLQQFAQYKMFADNQHQKMLVKEMRLNMRDWNKKKIRKESEIA